MSPAEKGLLLCTAFPAAGHFNPVLAVAKHMARTGLVDVSFVMPMEFKGSIERAGGIEHIETPSVAADIVAGLQQTEHMPADIDRMATQMGIIFFNTLAGRATRFHEVLQQKIASRQSGRRNVILIEDALSLASVPYRYWKPIPNSHTPDSGGGDGLGYGDLRLGTEDEAAALPAIGIGVSLLLLESEDTGPLLMGLPPDASPSGKLRNRELHRLVHQGPGMRFLQERWKAMLQELKCSGEDGEFRIWNTGYEAYHVVYQMSVPGAEYPISDLPTNVQFAGTLPREDFQNYPDPAWWDEVVVGKGTQNPRLGRRVIFVSQGTINGVYDDLIIPTIQAFADCPDISVVATLGVRGAMLPASTQMHLPPNARVVDYIPYDVILAHTDVFVTNGGYGAFTHAIRNGTPMVAAGESEEKKEVALRVTFSGAGVSLGTQYPTPDQVRKGVEEVLGSAKYKHRAAELMAESTKLNSLRTIEDKIRSLLT